MERIQDLVYTHVQGGQFRWGHCQHIDARIGHDIAFGEP